MTPGGGTGEPFPPRPVTLLALAGGTESSSRPIPLPYEGMKQGTYLVLPAVAYPTGGTVPPFPPPPPGLNYWKERHARDLNPHSQILRRPARAPHTAREMPAAIRRDPITHGGASWLKVDHRRASRFRENVTHERRPPVTRR